MKNCKILFISLCLSLPVQAADNNGQFTVLSVGSQPCAKYLEVFEDKGWEKLMSSVWVGGYLTAINQYQYNGVNVASNMDATSRDLWIYDYCHNNPDHKLNVAAFALYQYLLDDDQGDIRAR